MLKRSKFVIVVCGVLLFAAACSRKPASESTTNPVPAGSPSFVATNLYQGVGVVKALNPKRPGIEIEHEEIVGLMQGMQMEFPVSDAALLNGVGVNDRVDFTIDNTTGDMKIVAIKKK